MTHNLSISKINSFDKNLQNAEQYCLQNDFKLTPKRKQVLSVLLAAEKALSAYELIDLFKNKFNRKISPMSAYRVLDYLTNADLVHKIHLANKFVICAHIGSYNSHKPAHLLFCQQCQQVQEFPINPSVYKSFTNEIERTGNLFRSQNIELNCICSRCSGHISTVHN